MPPIFVIHGEREALTRGPHPGRRDRAEEDQQPFGVRYDGPALPQQVVDMDGTPLALPMVAVQDGAGQWRLWPIGDPDD